jgi:hypothetical protein
MAEQQTKADAVGLEAKRPAHRAAKLVEAMRANLRRRKKQQRARGPSTSDLHPDAEPVEEA